MREACDSSMDESDLLEDEDHTVPFSCSQTPLDLLLSVGAAVPRTLGPTCVFRPGRD